MSKYRSREYSEENARMLEENALSAGWFGGIFGTDSKKAEKNMVFTLSLLCLCISLLLALCKNEHADKFIGATAILLGYFIGQKVSR